MRDHLGLDALWWVPVFVAMAIIGVLGYGQVDLSVRVLSVLVMLEFLVVIVLDLWIAFKGGEGGKTSLTLSPFSWSALTSGSLAIAQLFNAASFIGFEATTRLMVNGQGPASLVDSLARLKPDPTASCSCSATPTSARPSPP